MQPTPAQIEAYQRDGFLVVEDFLDDDELERVREHFARGSRTSGRPVCRRTRSTTRPA